MTARATLHALGVGALPPGLTPDQHTRLAELSTRAATIPELFVLVTGTEQTRAMAPDTGVLVLVLRD